jgi:cytosine/adenosine deaminase-related metal-dependent hydrolase
VQLTYEKQDTRAYEMANPLTFRARWILPVDQPPVRGGTFTVLDGRIAAVSASAKRSTDVDLGDVAVLPGLVNAHAHLDLTALHGCIPPPTGFAEWLRQVVSYRRSSDAMEWQSAVRSGIEESLLAGTTLLGDISTSGASAPLLAASPLRSTVFHEIIGLTRPRAKVTWNHAKLWLQGQAPTADCRVGLSPHAPYSVRRGLWRLASRCNVPLAVHWAETPEEDELLERRSGPLREFLEDVGAWDAHGLAESRGWIERQLQAASRVLYVHGNYLDRMRIKSAMAIAHSAVVFCPRTHAYFGHARHPFLELLDARINVALGTDSLASNPDLSILEEMRFLWRQHVGRLSGGELLRLGTLNGAIALGCERDTGSLAPGKSADWITVPLQGGSVDDPHDAIFVSSLPVRDVFIAGRCVVQGGRMTRPLAAD